MSNSIKEFYDIIDNNKFTSLKGKNLGEVSWKTRKLYLKCEVKEDQDENYVNVEKLDKLEKTPEEQRLYYSVLKYIAYFCNSIITCKSTIINWLKDDKVANHYELHNFLEENFFGKEYGMTSVNFHPFLSNVPNTKDPFRSMIVCFLDFLEYYYPTALIEEDKNYFKDLRGFIKNDRIEYTLRKETSNYSETLAEEKEKFDNAKKESDNDKYNEELSQKKFKLLGNIGEFYANNYLYNLDHISNVKLISKEYGDHYGHDIYYYDLEKEQEFIIEVKTTEENEEFRLSKPELDFLKAFNNNYPNCEYRLYRMVYDNNKKDLIEGYVLIYNEKEDCFEFESSLFGELPEELKDVCYKKNKIDSNGGIWFAPFKKSELNNKEVKPTKVLGLSLKK